MRLKPWFGARGFRAGFRALAWLLLAVPSALAGSENPSERELSDLLGPLVVEATRPSDGQRRFMRVAIAPSLDGSPVDVLLHSIVGRDLALSGEFIQADPKNFPADAHDRSRPPELEAWKRLGVEAVIRLSGKLSGANAELSGEIYLTSTSVADAFRERVLARLDERRLGAHRLTDALMGALLGRPGGFASRLSFVQTTGRSRQAFVIDSDGHDLRIVAPEHDPVSAVTFGPGESPFLAASVRHGRYQLYLEDAHKPIELLPLGSIYGMAWSRSRSKLALAVATGTSVRVFAGDTNQRQLVLQSKTDIALSPAFSPSDKLAYAGIEKGRSRIYVDGKAVSPRSLPASAPTFCNHPDGLRLVYSVGVAKRTDLVSSDERGGMVRRVTRGPGSNGYAACSPDGRLLAFFSTRTTHDGPGLYVMPLSGGRPRRISSAFGHGLSWSGTLPE